MAFIRLQILTFLLFIGSASALADVKIVVGSNVDGHYLNARIVARHFGGVVHVVPGAAGLNAANYLATVSARDGSEIGTFTSRVFLSALFDDPAARYDLATMHWLGSFVDGRKNPNIVWVKPNQELIGGSDGSVSVSPFKVLNRVLRSQIREITGYSDVNTIRLAFERNEITAVVFNLVGVKTVSPHWLGSSDVKPYLQYNFGTVRHPEFPDVPTAMEQIADPQDRDLFALFEMQGVLVRPYALPPGVPSAMVVKWRDTFAKLMTNEEYIRDAQKIGLELTPVSAHEAQEIATQIARADVSLKTSLRSLASR